jgi:hypothetical protein
MEVAIVSPVRLYAVPVLVLIALALFQPVRGRADGPVYAQMAPLGQYLDADRSAEIALARSAAPPAISSHATILVLSKHGYETAEPGTNGFTCLVERSWQKAFDDTEFWDQKMRAPVCYNAAASRSALPYTIFRTRLVLSGVTKAQLFDRLKSAIADKELPGLELGAIAYMMSKEQHLTDAGSPSWYPHVMFYGPAADGADAGASWGADRRGSPVVFDSDHSVGPEPWAVFFVPVAHWSDGTPSPA